MIENLGRILVEEIATEGRKVNRVGCSLKRLWDVYERYHQKEYGELTDGYKWFIFTQLKRIKSVKIKTKYEINDINELKENEKKIYLCTSSERVCRSVSNNTFIQMKDDNGGMDVLEEIVKGRFEGAVQAQISKNLDMCPKSVFHHLKALYANKLVYSTSVSTQKCATNLLIYHRFIQLERDICGIINSNDNVYCDVERVRRDIMEILSEHKQQTLINGDLYQLVLDRGHSVSRKYFKSVLYRMAELKLVEKVLVVNENGKFNHAIKLLSGVEKEEDETGVDVIKSIGLRTDLSFIHQIYLIIAAKGDEGTTSIELRQMLNQLRPKDLSHVLATLESRKKIKKIVTSVGRSRVYRYYTVGRNSLLDSDVELTSNLLLSEQSTTKDDDKRETSRNQVLFTSFFEERKYNLLRLITDLGGVVEFNQQLVNKYTQRHPSKYQLDNKSLKRAAQDLQSQGRLNIYVIAVQKFGNKFESKTFCALPGIESNGPEMKNLLDQIEQDQMNFINSNKSNYMNKRVLEEDIDRYNMHQKKKKYATGENESSSSSSVSDDDDVKFEMKLRRKKVQQKKQLSKYFIKPRMLRAKALHEFILKYSQTDFQPSKLFRDLPLEIYLKCIRVNPGNALEDYLLMDGDLSIAICKLSYSVAKELYSIGLASFKHQLKQLLDILCDLDLLTAVEQGRYLITQIPTSHEAFWSGLNREELPKEYMRVKQNWQERFVLSEEQKMELDNFYSERGNQILIQELSLQMNIEKKIISQYFKRKAQLLNEVDNNPEVVQEKKRFTVKQQLRREAKRLNAQLEPPEPPKVITNDNPLSLEEAKVCFIAYAIQKIESNLIKWTLINEYILTEAFGKDAQRTRQQMIRSRVNAMMRTKLWQQRFNHLAKIYPRLIQASINDNLLSPDADLYTKVKLLQILNVFNNESSTPDSPLHVEKRLLPQDLTTVQIVPITVNRKLFNFQTSSIIQINTQKQTFIPGLLSLIKHQSQENDVLSVLKSMLLIDYSPEVAFSKLKEFTESQCKNAVFDLKQRGLIVDKSPIQPSKRFQDLLLSFDNDLLQCNDDLHFENITSPSETTNKQMAKLFYSLVFHQNVSIKLSFECPSSSILHRKEIEGRGLEGLSIYDFSVKTLSSPAGQKLIVPVEESQGCCWVDFTTGKVDEGLFQTLQNVLLQMVVKRPGLTVQQLNFALSNFYSEKELSLLIQSNPHLYVDDLNCVFNKF